MAAKKNERFLNEASHSLIYIFVLRTERLIMKVLFCYYLPSGGTLTLNRQREKALELVNIKSHFLYLHHGSGIKNTRQSKVWITNDDGEIQKLLQTERYDAIVVNSDADLLKRLRNLHYKNPLIYEVQGLGTISQANQYLRLKAKANINNYCDAILYPKTKHLQQLMKSIFPHKKQFSIHNCIDTETFTYKQQAKHANIIIGWVGRIEPNKNWSECLSIAKRLMLEIPNIELWMFIDDSLTKPAEKIKFQTKLHQLQLQKTVKIFDNAPHDEMPNYYSLIADSGGFLLSTSIMEGFGYAVLEALSCKCPVLTTKSDGVESFVFHNVTGKYYRHGNIDEAVREAKALIFNPELRKKISEQGANYVKAHFNLRQYAQHFRNMLFHVKKPS